MRNPTVKKVSNVIGTLGRLRQKSVVEKEAQPFSSLRILNPGNAFPGFRILKDENGWASFSTTDFWRNLPSVPITLLTFFTVGFLIVYLLGTRSFCRYGCPYGVLF